MNFSVLILTYNEEKDIANCLKSVSASNDIVVLDSYSKDRTKEICQSHECRFFERKFTDYSDQRNFGLHEISYTNELLLILDADETATESLVQEITSLCNSDLDELHDVYFVRRRVLFQEKILKWNYTSGVWIERLVKPKRVTFYGSVHEKLKFEGENGFLKNYIIHNQFSKGLPTWLDRRKSYAQMESKIQKNSPANEIQPQSAVARRDRLKRFIYDRVPGFYVFYFIYNVVISLAFLDGIKGLKYVAIETYSFYITAKQLSDDSKPKEAEVFTGLGEKA